MNDKSERVHLEMQIRKYRHFLTHIRDEQFQRTAKDKIAELEQRLRQIDD